MERMSGHVSPGQAHSDGTQKKGGAPQANQQAVHGEKQAATRLAGRKERGSRSPASSWAPGLSASTDASPVTADRLSSGDENNGVYFLDSLAEGDSRPPRPRSAPQAPAENRPPAALFPAPPRCP